MFFFLRNLEIVTAGVSRNTTCFLIKCLQTKEIMLGAKEMIGRRSAGSSFQLVL
jgi:hypothetical protein